MSKIAISKIGMRLLFSFVFVVASSLAADVAGSWQGTIEAKAQGEKRPREVIVLDLKQSGPHVTGTIGPDGEVRWDIWDGRMEGDILKFRVQTGDGGQWFRFELRLLADELQGDVRDEKNESAPAMWLVAKRKPQ